MNTEITPTHWRMIVQRIYHGECVPFLGAGVNQGGKDDENLPLGSELALKILQLMTGVISANLSDLQSTIRFHKLEEYRQRTATALDKLRIMIAEPAGEELDQEKFHNILKGILPDEGELKLADLIINTKLERYEDLTRVALQDLARVSLRYRWETDEAGFMNDLQILIPDTERKPSSLLMTLGWLPFRLLVTTNFDRLMERAMELLNINDIKEPVDLVTHLGAALRVDEDPMARFLKSEFSDDLREQLEAFDPETPVSDDLLRQLIRELNNLLQERSLYHLSEVIGMAQGNLKPSAKVAEMVKQKPQTYLDVRRSRLLLEAVYPDKFRSHRPFDVVVQPVRGFQGEEVESTRRRLAEIETQKGTVLFKLHGTFAHGQPDPEKRPIITEEDYIEFLTYIGGQGEGIDPFITAKIKDSTLLFLGYGLEDWNFRALFKGLIEKMLPSEQRMSFAIQKKPSAFWVKYWERKGVIIYDMDLYEFAGQLERRYKEYVSQQEKQRGPSGEAGPRPAGRGPVKSGRL